MTALYILQAFSEIVFAIAGTTSLCLLALLTMNGSTTPSLAGSASSGRSTTGTSTPSSSWQSRSSSPKSESSSAGGRGSSVSGVAPSTSPSTLRVVIRDRESSRRWIEDRLQVRLSAIARVLDLPPTVLLVDLQRRGYLPQSSDPWVAGDLADELLAAWEAPIGGGK